MPRHPDFPRRDAARRKFDLERRARAEAKRMKVTRSKERSIRETVLERELEDVPIKGGRRP